MDFTKLKDYLVSTITGFSSLITLKPIQGGRSQGTGVALAVVGVLLFTGHIQLADGTLSQQMISLCDLVQKLSGLFATFGGAFMYFFAAKVHAQNQAMLAAVAK